MGIPEKLDRLQSIIKDLGGQDKDLPAFFENLKKEIEENERQLEILAVAGAELSKEQEQSAALALILYTARDLTNADAGTVYSILEIYHDYPYNPGELESKSLVFEEMHTQSKNNFDTKPNQKPVPMEIDGKPNNSHVSAYCANTGAIVNIPDVYEEKGFDFSGTKKYDQLNNYRSKSMLVIPLRDHENQVNGVLQLINRQNVKGEMVPFTKNDQTIVQAMSYQAAISLTTQKLLRAQIELFNSFVRVLAEGLGEKSPYTFGHINRVRELSSSLARTIDRWNEGLYRNIHFSKYQMEEIHLAGWMHDIGKLTTPEHVVSKPLKLQLLQNRFELIIQRFNSKIKDLEIEALRKRLSALKETENTEYIAKIEKEKKLKLKEMLKDLKHLNRTNSGGEFLAEDDKEVIQKYNQENTDQYFRIKTGKVSGETRIVDVKLAAKNFKEPLVDNMEKEYLSISKGTLSAKERTIITEHADRSWNWLMKLPFPKKMMKLPLHAGAHHETLNGKGYPNRLKSNQLPIQSRIIAIADIFEALTANDRPYKKPMRLSQALDILGEMVKNGELDAEIVKIFLKSGLYLKYADDFLDPDQINKNNVDNWLKRYYPNDFKNSLPN